MLSTMARKPKKSPTADRHLDPVVSFRPSPEMRQTLKVLAEKERRPLSQILEFLIEEGLQQRGLWPPKADDE